MSTHRKEAIRLVDTPELKPYKEAVKKTAVQLQSKECCKVWTRLWYDGIYKLVRESEGVHFKYCPECKKKFKELTGDEPACQNFDKKLTEVVQQEEQK